MVEVDLATVVAECGDGYESVEEVWEDECEPCCLGQVCLREDEARMRRGELCSVRGRDDELVVVRQLLESFQFVDVCAGEIVTSGAGVDDGGIVMREGGDLCSSEGCGRGGYIDN